MISSTNWFSPSTITYYNSVTLRLIKEGNLVLELTQENLIESSV